MHVSIIDRVIFHICVCTVACAKYVLPQLIKLPLQLEYYMISCDYLAHWLQTFVGAGMVDSSHLMYQEIDAFITEQLRQPYPVDN